MADKYLGINELPALWGRIKDRLSKKVDVKNGLLDKPSLLEGEAIMSDSANIPPATEGVQNNYQTIVSGTPSSRSYSHMSPSEIASKDYVDVKIIRSNDSISLNIKELLGDFEEFKKNVSELKDPEKKQNEYITVPKNSVSLRDKIPPIFPLFEAVIKKMRDEYIIVMDGMHVYEHLFNTLQTFMGDWQSRKNTKNDADITAAVDRISGEVKTCNSNFLMNMNTIAGHSHKIIGIQEQLGEIPKEKTKPTILTWGILSAPRLTFGVAIEKIVQVIGDMSEFKTLFNSDTPISISGILKNFQTKYLLKSEFDTEKNRLDNRVTDLDNKTTTNLSNKVNIEHGTLNSPTLTSPNISGVATYNVGVGNAFSGLQIPSADFVENSIGTEINKIKQETISPIDRNVGNLDNLKTLDKSNLVSALNELRTMITIPEGSTIIEIEQAAEIKNNIKKLFDMVGDLSPFKNSGDQSDKAVSTILSELKSQLGDMSKLTISDVGSITDALNKLIQGNTEIKSSLDEQIKKLLKAIGNAVTLDGYTPTSGFIRMSKEIAGWSSMPTSLTDATNCLAIRLIGVKKECDQKAYKSELPDISGKADKSELTKYAIKAELPDFAQYATKNDLTSKVDSADYISTINTLKSVTIGQNGIGKDNNFKPPDSVSSINDLGGGANTTLHSLYDTVDLLAIKLIHSDSKISRNQAEIIANANSTKEKLATKVDINNGALNSPTVSGMKLTTMPVYTGAALDKSKNDNTLADTRFVQAAINDANASFINQLNAKAPLNSPTFMGEIYLQGKTTTGNPIKYKFEQDDPPKGDSSGWVPTTRWMQGELDGQIKKLLKVMGSAVTLNSYTPPPGFTQMTNDVGSWTYMPKTVTDSTDILAGRLLEVKKSCDKKADKSELTQYAKKSEIPEKQDLSGYAKSTSPTFTGDIYLQGNTSTGNPIKYKYKQDDPPRGDSSGWVPTTRWVQGELGGLISENTLRAFEAMGWSRPEGGVLASLIGFIAHPIGSYYWSEKPTDPAKIFGGRWERVEDKFVYAAGSKTVGVTGGEERHTLTVDEMPQHNGHVKPYGGVAAYLNAQLTNYGDSGRGWIRINGNEPFPYNENTGGSESHNNMPPYVTAYCWKRIG